MYVNQIILQCNWNLQSAVCQLHLNKTREKTFEIHKIKHIPGKGIILNQFKFTSDSVNILNEIFILDILFMKDCVKIMNMESVK